VPTRFWQFAMKRYFNDSNINDPNWNIAGCSPNTSYLLVGDLALGNFCACERTFTGPTCSYYQPSVPYIRLIITQIILGSFACLLWISALSMIIATATKLARNKAIKILAALVLIIGLTIRIIWIIDTWEYNDTYRYIPQSVGTFLFWCPYAFETCSVAFILGLWYQKSFLSTITMLIPFALPISGLKF